MANPKCPENNMEPIILVLNEGGSSEVDDPHEGEEFGYVLIGSIYIYLGNQRFRVKKERASTLNHL